MSSWDKYTIARGRFYADTRTFRCRKAKFRPVGEVYAWGDVTKLRANPTEKIDVVPLTARIFVGLNVGQTPTYDIQDVMRIVKRVRKKQGATPDSSFLFQRGFFTDEVTAETVEENSVQVVLFDFSGDEDKFEEDMSELGETLATGLQQQVVFVEMQKRGVPYRVLRVTP